MGLIFFLGMPLLPPRASMSAWGFGGDEKQFNMKDIFVICSAGVSLAALRCVDGLRRSAGGELATASAIPAARQEKNSPKKCASVM